MDIGNLGKPLHFHPCWFLSMVGSPTSVFQNQVPSTGDAEMGKAQSLPSESSQCNGAGMWAIDTGSSYLHT